MSGENFAVQGPVEIEPTEAELTGAAPGDVPPSTEVPGKEAVPSPGDPAAPPFQPIEPPKDIRTVPLAALHEERRARQALAAELEAIRNRAEPRKSPAELILEDPENAMTTLMDEINSLRMEITRGSMEREINEAVPDFLDIAPQMEEVLLNAGLNDETIRNVIGASGTDAPKFFKLLATMVKQPNEESMRAKITAELTPAITANVTKELMAKFKIVQGDPSIHKIPGKAPDEKLNIGSEVEFAKLTPEQQEAWLSGRL